MFNGHEPAISILKTLPSLLSETFSTHKIRGSSWGHVVKGLNEERSHLLAADVRCTEGTLYLVAQSL